MSWTAGRFALTAGQSLTLDVSFGGRYVGPQFIQARPVGGTLSGIFPVRLRGSVETVVHGVRVSPQPQAPGNDEWVYTVVVRNVTPASTAGLVLFELMGGGVT